MAEVTERDENNGPSLHLAALGPSARSTNKVVVLLFPGLRLLTQPACII